jgi:hypothetical protein
MGLTRIRAEQISDIDYKQAVRVVTVDNIELSGGAPAVVDGVNLVPGNRILVTGNTSKSENGIYVVESLGTGSNGTWARSADANETGEITAGLVVMVTEGDGYEDTQWKLITNDPIVLNVSELEFVPVLGSSEFGMETLSYTGDGSTTTFLVSTGQQTNTVLAFLNGIAQTPTIDYNVVGSNIVFAVAPGNDVSIILREFSSSQAALAGNVVLGSTENNTLTINSVITSNLIPSEDVTYDLGSDSLRWRDLYLAGNTLVLGDIVIKDTGENQIGFFQNDGTTPASIDPTNVDTSQIANGTSSLVVAAADGNIIATIGSTQVAILSSTGLTAIDVTATGNVSAVDVTATGNVSSLFNISQRTITANTTIGNVNASSVGPIIIAEGVIVTVEPGGEWSIV